MLLLLVECLRPNSTYEFRVIARARDGSVSAPSAVSDVVQLRPSIKSGVLHGVPAKPQPPEYVDFGNGDRVTLCWFPAASSLPIQVKLKKFFCHLWQSSKIVFDSSRVMMLNFETISRMLSGTGLMKHLFALAK